MQQILDEANFIKNQFIPFGFSNQGRDTRTSIGSKIEPFIGIAPAPYDINMTKAELKQWRVMSHKLFNIEQNIESILGGITKGLNTGYRIYHLNIL